MLFASISLSYKLFASFRIEVSMEGPKIWLDLNKKGELKTLDLIKKNQDRFNWLDQYVEECKKKLGVECQEEPSFVPKVMYFLRLRCVIWFLASNARPRPQFSESHYVVHNSKTRVDKIFFSCSFSILLIFRPRVRKEPREVEEKPSKERMIPLVKMMLHRILYRCRELPRERGMYILFSFFAIIINYWLDAKFYFRWFILLIYFLCLNSQCCCILAILSSRSRSRSWFCINLNVHH